MTKENLKDMEQMLLKSVEQEPEESLSPEEAQAKIAMLLAKTEHLEVMSELDDDEIKLIAALRTIAKLFNNDVLNTYVDYYLKLKVSRFREGRREIKDIAVPQPSQKEKLRKSIKDILMGLR